MMMTNNNIGLNTGAIDRRLNTPVLTTVPTTPLTTTPTLIRPLTTIPTTPTLPTVPTSKPWLTDWSDPIRRRLENTMVRPLQISPAIERRIEQSPGDRAIQEAAERSRNAPEQSTAWTIPTPKTEPEPERVYTDEYISMLPGDIKGQTGPRGEASSAPSWLSGQKSDEGEGEGEHTSVPQVAPDLSKTHYKDPLKATDGEEIYLTDYWQGNKTIHETGRSNKVDSPEIPPGNYTVTRETEKGTITGEVRVRTYLTAPDGTKYHVATDNRKASDTWDFWDNPLWIPSWFT